VGDQALPGKSTKKAKGTDDAKHSTPKRGRDPLARSMESTMKSNDSRVMRNSMEPESRISSPPRNVMDRRLNRVDEIEKSHKPRIKELRPKSPKEATSPNEVELRVNFNEHLTRLYNRSTMETGMKGCHEMIKENCEDRAMVRIVIGALTDPRIVA
jgi:hypothetical protein